MGSIHGVATPPGYIVRPATWDDLAGVVELFRQADTEDWGEVDMTETSLREEWENPNLDLSQEFRRRGFEKVGLSVDSSNETGATALYERVGMRVTRQYDVYEKQLR